jgi:hypothetical protein
MYNLIFFLLLSLFIKHWYIDFVNQNDAEVQSKGIYLHPTGLGHSLKHGGATSLIFFIFGFSFIYSLVIGILDFLIHYHVDWTKMNYGNRDIRTPQFWNHLGLDQLAHYITYLWIVWISL